MSHSNNAQDAESSELLCRTPPVGMRPRRGLILTHNHRMRYLREKDMHRWLAYGVRVLECLKFDVLAWGPVPNSLPSIIWYARELAVPVSLRTDGASPPASLAYLASEGLADLFLCPPALTDKSWRVWLKACQQLSLPIRLQFQIPRIEDASVNTLADEWNVAGVKSVNLVLADPFQPVSRCNNAKEGQAVIESCNALAEALQTRDIEVNIYGCPPGLLKPVVSQCAGGQRAFFNDYQQYDQTAYRFAQRLYASRPATARAALLVEMKRHTVSLGMTDRWLMKTLYVRSRPLYHGWLCLARRWRALRGTPLSRSIQESPEAAPDETSPGIIFNQDEMRRATQLLGGYMGGTANTESLSAGASRRPRYMDPVDRDRLERYALWRDLAREAQDWQRRTPPTRVCDMKDWGTEEAFMVPEYGATAWLTFMAGERVSNDFDDPAPPYMASVTVGGGLAEAVGFRVGTFFTVMCPLVEARHTVTLYVREDGRYVLLRDGVPVEAVHRPGQYSSPLRAPSFGKIRVVAWDIEERVSFAPLRIWKEKVEQRPATTLPKYSVVIFCTRFARRLSATLQCLVHQHDFDLSLLEVVVGYVPGLDATEDVLDSLRQLCPSLRIIHAPFPRQNIRSKGYVLNQCMAMSSGEWLLLLDADTLLPPYMFSALEKATPDQSFIFPQGRAMLDARTTARVLMGEARPWQAWEELLQSAAALRTDEALGAPIGYCQCFRRSCLARARYPEYEHFQGADFEFAQAMRQHFGKEYRLDFPVLHLDHEGSQWFGAERHF